MPLNSNSIEQKTDFAEKMEALSDADLTDVLRKRNLYQDAAAKEAIRLAIERGIIQSELDLSGPDFREKKLKRQLFPEIEDENIRNKIRRSISRGFILAGSLPGILAVIRLTRGSQTEGILLLVFAVAWLGSSVWLFRVFSRHAFLILTGLLILSLVYILKLLFSWPANHIMDKFIVVMLYLLITYGLLYIRRLYK